MKELDCKLKIIWLLVTYRVKQMVLIDITNVMMDNVEDDWWEITLKRLRSHYRASIEKESKRGSFEEVNAQEIIMQGQEAKDESPKRMPRATGRLARGASLG